MVPPPTRRFPVFAFVEPAKGNEKNNKPWIRPSLTGRIPKSLNESRSVVLASYPILLACVWLKLRKFDLHVSVLSVQIQILFSIYSRQYDVKLTHFKRLSKTSGYP